MANRITSLRFFLLFVLVAMAYLAPPVWQLVNAPLLILIIALDGLDGYVARRRNETSTFGSLYDIAVDRVVENVLWIVLADLNLVPIWVAIVFITRSFVVDTLRAHTVSRGGKVFDRAAGSALSRFLVAGRFMRGLYGTLKAATFGYLFLIQPLPALLPELWQSWSLALGGIGSLLVYLSVAICLLRGLPVIADAVVEHGFFRYRRSEVSRGAR
jgi:CDP-diacylglycerol---glycerol-3-phosphate 3-phosphatidyltransferase